MSNQLTPTDELLQCGTVGHQLNDAPILDKSTQVLPAEYNTTISRPICSWSFCKLREKPTGVYDPCKVYSLFRTQQCRHRCGEWQDIESGQTTSCMDIKHTHTHCEICCCATAFAVGPKRAQADHVSWTEQIESNVRLREPFHRNLELYPNTRQGRTGRTYIGRVKSHHTSLSRNQSLSLACHMCIDLGYTTFTCSSTLQQLK